MAKKYTINVTHLWQDKTQTFFLFQEMPKVVNGPSGTIFTNVFQVAPSVVGQADGSSTLSFSMDNEFFVIFGTKQGTDKASLDTSSFKSVKLGPNGSVVALKARDNYTTWDAAKFSEDFSGDGGFKFITDDSFDSTNPKNIFFGVGGVEPKHRRIIPLQSWAAEPSLTSQLYPKATYYLGTGSFSPGQFVDKKDIGKCVMIDFQTATGNSPVVHLSYDSRGDFVDDMKASGPALSRGIKIQLIDN